jgi:formylglycine-generating enzyme required for sulfatase activity
MPPEVSTASTSLAWTRGPLVAALLLALAAPVWSQLNPITENQRRAEEAEAQRKRAEKDRQEAQRRQQQAERDKAEALERADRERAAALERARRAEEELARLKAQQSAAPAPSPSVAKPQPAPPPAESYPVVDGLPEDRLRALQREAAARAGVGVEFSDRLRDGRDGPKLVVIPAGRFQMGSNTAFSDAYEKPPHPRRVDAFALMKTEVTVGQYLACVSAGGCREPMWREAGNPYHYQTGSDNFYRKFGAALTDPNSPVVGVSWENARQYAAWLTGLTGHKYRLPTEAEWEFAARSGSTARWSFGDDESKLGQYARFSGNSQGRMWAVGGLQPNAWGLHDMHGNVWEWVQDCWHDSYGVAGRPQTGQAWETGCTATYRMVRGGSWRDNQDRQRSAGRNGNAPGYRFDDLGFRLARTL